MEIYSYHYGAAAGRDTGVLARSGELENLPLGSFLKDLSSLRALESSGHRGEKLCCLLERDGYTILGLSYPESPEDSLVYPWLAERAARAALCRPDG